MDVPQGRVRPGLPYWFCFPDFFLTKPTLTPGLDCTRAVDIDLYVYDLIGFKKHIRLTCHAFIQYLDICACGGHGSVFDLRAALFLHLFELFRIKAWTRSRRIILLVCHTADSTQVVCYTV